MFAMEEIPINSEQNHNPKGSRTISGIPVDNFYNLDNSKICEIL